MTKQVPKFYVGYASCWNCKKPLRFRIPRGMSIEEAEQANRCVTCRRCGCQVVPDAAQGLQVVDWPPKK